MKLPWKRDDPADYKFIACAIALKADYIVSGDGHLTLKEKIDDIIIITPYHYSFGHVETLKKARNTEEPKPEDPATSNKINSSLSTCSYISKHSFR